MYSIKKYVVYIALLLVLISVAGYFVNKYQKNKKIFEQAKQKVPEYFVKSKDKLEYASEKGKNVPGLFEQEKLQAGVSYVLNKSLKDSAGDFIVEARANNYKFLEGTTQNKTSAVYHIRSEKGGMVILMEKINDSSTKVTVLPTTLETFNNTQGR